MHFFLQLGLEGASLDFLVERCHVHPPLLITEKKASFVFLWRGKFDPRFHQRFHDQASLVLVSHSVFRFDKVDSCRTARTCHSAHNVDAALLDSAAPAGSANHLFDLACANVVIECEDNDECICCELEIEPASKAPR